MASPQVNSVEFGECNTQGADETPLLDLDSNDGYGVQQYMNDGDEEMYTEEALLAREAIKGNRAVKKQIARFWKTHKKTKRGRLLRREV